jgi:hypothetical protein
MSNRFSAGPVDLTTTDAAIAVIDANVDAVLVDTGTTIPGTLINVKPLWFPYQFNAYTASATFVSLTTDPMLTLPTISGATFLVKTYIPNYFVGNILATAYLELWGSIVGDAAVPTQTEDNLNTASRSVTLAGEFGSGEQVTVKAKISGGYNVRVHGEGYSVAYRTD